MKGNDFLEIESAFKKISHKLNLEFFRKSSSISNEKKKKESHPKCKSTAFSITNGIKK